jgi:hypothetical protein
MSKRFYAMKGIMLTATKSKVCWHVLTSMRERLYMIYFKAHPLATDLSVGVNKRALSVIAPPYGMTNRAWYCS